MFILPSGKCVNDILGSTFQIHFNNLSSTICILSYVLTGRCLYVCVCKEISGNAVLVEGRRLIYLPSRSLSPSFLQDEWIFRVENSEGMKNRLSASECLPVQRGSIKFS